jgi:hypothetical protein
MTCSGGTYLVRVNFVDAYRYGRDVYVSTVKVSLTPSGVIGKEDDLFIMDYDSNYLEYQFRNKI